MSEDRYVMYLEQLPDAQLIDFLMELYRDMVSPENRHKDLETAIIRLKRNDVDGFENKIPLQLQLARRVRDNKGGYHPKRLNIWYLVQIVYLNSRQKYVLTIGDNRFPISVITPRLRKYKLVNLEL